MKNERHPIDDLFRKGLGGLETVPNEEQKALFLKEADSPVIRKSNRKFLFFLAGLFVLLSGTAVISYFTLNEKPEHKPVVNTGAANKSLSPAAVQPVESIQSFPASTSKETSQATEKSQKTISKQELSYAGNETSEESAATGNATESVMQPEISMIQTYEKTDAAAPDSTPSPEIIEKDNVTSPIVPTAPVAIKGPDTATSSDSPPPVKSKKQRDWSISAGVSYSPEWMFNTLEGEKFVNNFGIEGTFSFGRYSVRTGAGLSIAKGFTEMAIGYNDYLGSYKKLDSISFAWDEQHYHMLPTYILSDESVWDSLMKLDHLKIEKRYIYLQIPLVLGYDVIQKNRFSLGFRIGPVLSILLSSKELTAEYDPGMNRIVQVNQITPDRIQTNWQAMGGINVAYMLSKRIKIELEPEGRYYFNSVYEKGGVTQKPWSVGVRTAVIFTF